MSAGPRLRRAGLALLPVLIVLVAAWELRRQAIAMDWDALRLALAGVEPTAALLSLLATAASFAGLALIEAWVARGRVRLRVPVATAMAAGAASHAFSHVLGWHAVLGTLVRRRAYSASGASPAQLLRILLGVGAAVAAGAVAFLAVAIAAWHSGFAGWLVAGALALLSLWGWRSGNASTPANDGLAVIAVRPLGRLAHATAIVPIAMLEAVACLAALWVLLPAGTYAGWHVFVVTCLLAQAAGVASHVPGGMGVFEAAMLTSVPADARPGVLAAILAYRALYGLVPIVLIGLPWLAWSWLRRTSPAADQLEIG